MANSYDGGSKYFDIDTSTNVAGLTALKGSAPDADDWVYVFEGATVTVEQSVSLRSFYFGDSYSGTASTKAGHLSVNAGVTITFAGIANHEGFSGEGGYNVLTFSGTSGSRISVVCSASNKCSNTNIYLSEIIAQYTDFIGLVWLQIGRAQTLSNCRIVNPNRGIYITTHNGTIQNGNWDGLEIVNAAEAGIHEATTGSPVAWGNFLKTNEVKLVGGAGGQSPLTLRYGDEDSEGRYISYRQNYYSIKTAPSFSGIQSLSANNDLTIDAAWNSTTHATGDAVGYRVYIRAGAAPDSFGKSSAYFLCETRDTGFRIAKDAAGSALFNGTVYYVVVRAATDDSDEDTNTTSLSAEALDVSPTPPAAHIPIAVSIANLNAVQVAVTVD